MDKISIIIPAFNAELFLQDAIDSVLMQKCSSQLEIIVIDDGSTDETAQIAQGYDGVVYRHQKQQGQAVARNAGLAICTGNYIGFLDADDIFVDNKLLLQKTAMENDPQLDAVFGHITEFLDERGVAAQHRPPVTVAPAYLPGTALVRRSLAEKIGEFNPSLRLGEFIDWVSRARALNMKEKMLPEVVLKRRLHLTNFGVNRTEDLSDYVHTVHAHLKRMRKTADEKITPSG
jgi:glycosyltransferase involved in cell wall biosynthesis